MTQIPEESELLALLDKSEEEQKKFLLKIAACTKQGVIQECPDCERLWVRWTTLPELAERLMGMLTPSQFRIGLEVVFRHFYPCPILAEELLECHSIRCVWLMDNYKPVYIIVAALIALKRAGVEI